MVNLNFNNLNTLNINHKFNVDSLCRVGVEAAVLFSLVTPVTAMLKGRGRLAGGVGRGLNAACTLLDIDMAAPLLMLNELVGREGVTSPDLTPVSHMRLMGGLGQRS